MTPLYVNQDSFQPEQGTRFNSDAITRRQKWPRLMRHTRHDESLYRMDFSFVDSRGSVIESDNLYYARRLQYRKPVLWIKAAEQISWEQRRIDFFDSIRPPLPQLVKGQKLLVALSVELLSDAGFLPGAHLQRKPRKMGASLQLGVKSWETGLWLFAHCPDTLPPRESHPDSPTQRMVLHDCCHWAEVLLNS